MMTSKVIYTGDLRTEMTHLQSGDVVFTDAPKDNHGKGEAFSPTDLVSSALASCMISLMGIKAKLNNWRIEGTTAEVTKVMASEPRRISEIHIVIRIPSTELSEKDKKILENTALTCPVAISLNPSIIQNVQFNWI